MELMAIGADRPAVLIMVLRQGLLLAVGGLGAGLIASAGVERVLPWMVLGSGSGGIDPTAFVFVATAVLSVTLVAAYVPARRASRVNPTDALRHD